MVYHIPYIIKKWKMENQKLKKIIWLANFQTQQEMNQHETKDFFSMISNQPIPYYF